MTPQTWAALQAHGVTEETELRLDFQFVAPREHAADELIAYLRLETDYDIELDWTEDDGEERRWLVVGATHPAALSQTIIEDWVRWMVSAGAHYGQCRFDGWGASAG
jgi:hypothetical protein